MPLSLVTGAVESHSSSSIFPSPLLPSRSPKVMYVLCDLCREHMASIHCPSDGVSLCISCDEHVHNANTISQQHLRYLRCESCHLDIPIRCSEDRFQPCQNGCWNPLRCYVPTDQQPPEHHSGFAPPDDSVKIWVPTDPGIGRARSSSSLVGCRGNVLAPCGGDHFLKEPDQIKLDCLLNDVLHWDKNELDAVLNVGMADLSVEDSGKILRCPLQSHFGYTADQDGGNCMFAGKDLPVADVNGHIQTEVPSSSQHEIVHPQSSEMVGSAAEKVVQHDVDQLLAEPNDDRNIGMHFGSENESFDRLMGLVAEGSVVDCQDSRIPPLHLTGESNLETIRQRKEALLRFKEKKKRQRLYGNHVRYASRKVRADTRKRQRGRFVKAGEAYDYDPLTARVVEPQDPI